MPRFNTESFLNAIERFKVTELTFMPPMLIKVLQHPLCTKEKLASVRYVHGGGAAIEKRLQHRLLTLLRPDCPFTQIWGLSETSGAATILNWPEKDDTGSIGKLIPNLTAK